MSLASNVRTRTVADPLALRALAHPLTVELHTLVGREGSLTAADAARQLGISHGLASHYLRQLARYGFIESAEALGDRAHPWRITATNLDLRSDQPDARTALDILDRHAVEKASHQLAEWQERRD
jgi:DNA-binding transcriptional regulator GbsR (MarR family)